MNQNVNTAFFAVKSAAAFHILFVLIKTHTGHIVGHTGTVSLNINPGATDYMTLQLKTEASVNNQRERFSVEDDFGQIT